MLNTLFSKLDLDEYISEFRSLFSREKEVFLQGDNALHFKCINELSNKEFPTPPCVSKLENALMHLSKYGILHLNELFEFVKIIRYFAQLKNISFGTHLNTWLEKIKLPDTLLQWCENFNDKGELKEELDERLFHCNQCLHLKEEAIHNEFNRLLHSHSLNTFLIDTQIHLISGVETLLVRGGFHLKARIIGRSGGGGFYIIPSSIEKLQNEKEEISKQKEEIYYEYAVVFSALLRKNLRFLNFLNKAFDTFDHYSARVLLARKHNYEFIKCDSSNQIILKDFAHPSLKKPKSISVNFHKQLLLITGVNAGGKSMLLKSILAAALLAKYLLPMKIKAYESTIGSFKEFDIVIEDPQNSKNDISSFAGRMLHFSQLLTKKNLLLGIDEIELGTDFEESASLYSVLLEKLLENGQKIIITTHHKRLAMLLAKNEQVELLAALYDEEAAKARYEFLQGSIGKSYAFETALRYGITQNLIIKAKQMYGEDKSNLEQLVSKSVMLEFQLQEQLKKVKQKEEKVDTLLQTLKEQKEENEEKTKALLSKLQREFHLAIEEAKKTIILHDTKQKQRSLNKANELKKNILIPNTTHNDETFQINDFVKYGKIKGQIIALAKNDAIVQSDDLKMRVPIKLLKKSSHQKTTISKTHFHIDKPSKANLSLDLHGLRSDEALLKLDKFISDSLISGFDEIIVFHGIGTGKLAFAVREFLQEHKSVKSFSDAPMNQGGFGAKIIRL
ncbi:endonuclease MutS2 [Campylobacter sp. MIT 21-1685]|uniref:endonuclease MutS2 n=1 Tax=unclassified Campylobacter TaxID=2593542 RepID=UPI00224B9912|nr:MULTISPECIES: endonuclease MutS2 [unclassified Campylobacter]MCX2683148.1 endonuclease MutS2 [Campylobacter sp. MIT 21-1684]MCX2751393.1 endonuclease MutS2 [Campylobacter sp. MIT 21-1682]MCX2807592.1 endonuclease MutS2 [Campylobacter sp. MIT 21-1685]